jgi:hypothetical protein
VVVQLADLFYRFVLVLVEVVVRVEPVYLQFGLGDVFQCFCALYLKRDCGDRVALQQHAVVIFHDYVILYVGPHLDGSRVTLKRIDPTLLFGCSWLRVRVSRALLC